MPSNHAELAALKNMIAEADRFLPQRENCPRTALPDAANCCHQYRFQTPPGTASHAVALMVDVVSPLASWLCIISFWEAKRGLWVEFIYRRPQILR